MNSKMNRLRVVGGASVAALAASALVPTTALAASTSGADLLIPKPAEFIPALVAFVIIWVILTGVWALSGGGYFWPGWAIFGMGIALLFMGWGAYGPAERAPSEQEINDEMRKMGG